MPGIPKILHQLWIGPKQPPHNLLRTWKEKHPDFEYILWNEAEIAKRGIVFETQVQIDAIQEINGKADIMRWEILRNYGGVFVDADSICIEPFDDYFMQKTAFATYENETERKGLVATGTMGFVPQYAMCRDIVNIIKSGTLDDNIAAFRAWYSVGPALLTDMLKTGKYRDFAVFPSHCFLPHHFTGPKYEGHRKIYGYQEWGTAKSSYDTMNDVVLPKDLLYPDRWVSVLVTSYNTDAHHLKECLDSIKDQKGHFGIELVWIDDGSSTEYLTILNAALTDFKEKTRFTKIIYEKNATNLGAGASSNRGVLLCSHELIFRMDSDDIMMPNRIAVQMAFMDKMPDCAICGAAVETFSNPNNSKEKTRGNIIAHPYKFTWTEFMSKRPTWFLNHPTVCLRKSPLIEIGNYNIDHDYAGAMEDYELELRYLKKYGYIYSLSSVLVYYRIHEKQVTRFLSDPEQHAKHRLHKEKMDRINETIISLA